MYNIGQKIKELRKRSDLTQEKLADYLGVSYQAVSKWETGIACPDLSLIVPLARLFGVTTDELLGCAAPTTDQRKTELEETYQNTWETGDLEERFRVATEAVAEYPGDMEFIDRLAWATAMRSFQFEDNETYIAEQEKAIKLFAQVIEDCTDQKTRCSSIRGIVQYLSFRGRRDEAKTYADLYPDDPSFTKADVIEDCLVGDAKIKHRQQRLDNILFDLIDIMILGDRSLNAYIAAEGVLKAMFPDENYLHHHGTLFRIAIGQAQWHTANGNYNEAMNALQKALVHAKEYDLIDQNPDVYPHTAPLFDHYEIDTSKWVRTGTTTLEEDFYDTLTRPWADPIRNRENFRVLLS